MSNGTNIFYIRQDIENLKQKIIKGIELDSDKEPSEEQRRLMQLKLDREINEEQVRLILFCLNKSIMVSDNTQELKTRIEKLEKLDVRPLPKTFWVVYDKVAERWWLGLIGAGLGGSGLWKVLEILLGS